jgi:ATP-binding cassette subfamily B protein
MLFKNISGVFQNFQKYKMTLGDNISISNLGLTNDLKEHTLIQACHQAELDTTSKEFTKSFDTMLSREFDGVDLSGGQWQRVAIARGLYKANDIIVLDEPTAAIDPIEETRLYQQFAQLAKDKTAIIVTHRLGSAQIADRIVVMDKGEIVEMGMHRELLLKNGKYAEMYETQKKWYTNEKILKESHFSFFDQLSL